MRFQPIEFGVGFRVWPETCIVTNRSATVASVGDVLMFDMGAADAASVFTLDESSTAYALNNVVVPATAGIGGLSGQATLIGMAYWHCVVLDQMGNAGADDTKIKVGLRGRFRVSMTNSAILEGSPLSGANGVKTLKLHAATAGNKIFGIALQPNASTAGLYTCMFDGIYGFGQPVAS